MSNQSPENEVKKSCLNKLKTWQSWGVVIDFDDVSNLGRNMNLYTGRWFMHTKEGKRDLIAWFKVNKILWTYLIECKAPNGGVWKKEQQDYAKKFEGLDNVIYEIVSDSRQISITLERITQHQEKQLQLGDIIMGVSEKEVF